MPPASSIKELVSNQKKVDAQVNLDLDEKLNQRLNYKLNDHLSGSNVNLNMNSGTIQTPDNASKNLKICSIPASNSKLSDGNYRVD